MASGRGDGRKTEAGAGARAGAGAGAGAPPRYSGWLLGESAPVAPLRETPPPACHPNYRFQCKNLRFQCKNLFIFVLETHIRHHPCDASSRDRGLSRSVCACTQNHSSTKTSRDFNKKSRENTIFRTTHLHPRGGRQLSGLSHPHSLHAHSSLPLLLLLFLCTSE